MYFFFSSDLSTSSIAKDLGSTSRKGSVAMNDDTIYGKCPTSWEGVQYRIRRQEMEGMEEMEEIEALV